MLICARAYHEEENKSHIAPKIFCSLSGCYCMYVAWKQGRNDQSDKCIECPRYKRIDAIKAKAERNTPSCSNDRFLSNRSELVLQEIVRRMTSGGWSFDDAIKITQARLIAKSSSEDAYQLMQIYAAIGEVQEYVAKYYNKEPSLSSLEGAINIM